LFITIRDVRIIRQPDCFIGYPLPDRVFITPVAYSTEQYYHAVDTDTEDECTCAKPNIAKTEAPYVAVDNTVGFIGLFVVSTVSVYGSLPGLIGGVIATVAGLSAAVSGLKDINDGWRVMATDSVSIREAVEADAVVQLQGAARAPRSSDICVSPIYGEECVAYEYNMYYQVQSGGNPEIHSDTDCIPFTISDGTAKVCVDPTAESLSLEHETSTVTGREELFSQVHVDQSELPLPAHTGDSGLIEDRIELVEGTVSVGEMVTVVGKADPVPGRAAVDGVVTPAEGHLIVANDESTTVGLRTGARGFFLLILGSVFVIMGVIALVANAPVQ